MADKKKHSYKHPFECEKCSKHSSDDFEYFGPTDDWMILYPKEQAIHIHFGWATHSEKESTAETEWLNDFASKHWFPKYPDKKFFIMVDMTRSDDSELPSQRSIQLYKELFRNKQNSKTVFYGVTHSMKFFLKMVTSLSKTPKKIVIVDTLDQALEKYDEWAKTNVRT
ncbi:MAG: hypothetical protein ABIG66_00595 [Candidatus Kerfeldbacteria bacterium]